MFGLWVVVVKFCFGVIVFVGIVVFVGGRVGS